MFDLSSFRCLREDGDVFESVMQTTPFPAAGARVASLTDQRCVVALYRKTNALIQVSLHVQTPHNGVM